MSKYFNILIINGPNLNLLGIRETEKYYTNTLEKIIQNLNIQAKNIGVKLNHFQSNAEHEIINCIHQSIKKIDFIIINPASFTHSSLAIRDAFLAINIPFIEVHISNIFAREKYRRHSFLSDLAIGIIAGLGEDGYFFALKAAKKFLLTNLKIPQTSSN